MEKVIVAFAGLQNGKRIREILERSGTAACLLCTSADQVRRTVHEQQVPAVVCGYKFADARRSFCMRICPPSAIC